MPIAVTCPSCKKQFSVPDAYAGRSGKCTGCGVPLSVPAVVAAAVPAGGGLAASGDQLESFGAPAAPAPAPAAPAPAGASGGAPAFKPGDVIGGYKLVRRLGDAKSSVFLAQSAQGANVALKLLPPLGTGERAQTAAKRFLREARSLFGLEIPNVVKVLDAGEDVGCLYLAMEHFDAKTLRELMAARGGKLPEAEALSVAVQVARGLGGLAQQNLVHRNVKPDHVLVETGGRVKLVGLGLVKTTDDEGVNDNLTMKGHVVGTPQYMPPEQARGDAVDGRGDLFALGITLYEMLTGTVPWLDKTPMRTINLITNAPPPPLREKNPDVSPFTTEIVEKLLQKNPDARFKSADELVGVLAPLTGGAATTKVDRSEAPASPGATSAPAPAGGSDALVKKLLVAVGLLGVAVLALIVLVVVLLLHKP